MTLPRFVLAVLASAIIFAAAPINWSEAAGEVVEMPNGLKYTDTKIGAGAEATAGKKVSLHYTGWIYSNGTKGAKFDSSLDRGFAFALQYSRARVKTCRD